MKLTDEIRSFVNNLYDAGCRGNSCAYKGMRVCDEEHLTGLLIEATPFIDLPSVHELDKHNSLYGMIARYAKNESPELAWDIAEHLRDLFAHYYQDQIQHLMEDAHANSGTGQFEAREAEKDRERDIASYAKQRM